MGVCAFVASGLSFDVDSYLRSSPFEAKTVFRKGAVPRKANPAQQPRPDSGFVVLVSSGEGGLSAQVGAALEFLAKHEKHIAQLPKYGVDNMLLDFGVELGGQLQQAEYLPPELLLAMARFRMGIIFSAIRIPHG